MKLLGITQRVDFCSTKALTQDSLDQSLIRFVIQCGYLPIPIPNVLTKSLATWLNHIEPEGFILSGGNDLGSCLSRDVTEDVILSYAFERALPVLGICRGMQKMANWMDDVDLKQVYGHVKSRHFVSGEITREVNSFHDYSLVDEGANFHVLAKSDDGEIEAIRHKTLPWEGWMWHPERDIHYSVHDIARLRSLVD